MLLSLLDRLGPILALIVIGYGLAQQGQLTRDGLQGLTRLTYWILIPATMFQTVSHIHVGAILDVRLWAVYFGSAFATAVVIYGALRVRPEKTPVERIVLSFAGVYSNLGILGLPIVASLFGDRGVIVLTAIISIHALTLITPTVFLVSGLGPKGEKTPSVAGTLRKQFTNPIILSIAAGLAASGLGIAIPGPLEALTSMLKAAMPPIALIVIGAGLYGQRLSGYVASGSIAAIGKMFLMPLTVFLVGRGAGLSQAVLAPAIVCAALPPGINAVLMAAAFETAVENVSTLLLLSTVVAVFTIPALSVLFLM